MRIRRLFGAYLVLFFLAVSAAPHHHINDLDDLLLDQRSDSGLIPLPGPSGPSSGAPKITPLRLIQDVPCLACFTRDFFCSLAVTIVFVPSLTPLPSAPGLAAAARPYLVPADTSSRAPPRIS